MRARIGEKVLGTFDLLLALGAAYTGTMMMASRSGIFAAYPQEWLTKTPFRTWVVPGVIVLLLFGLGNVAAAVASLRRLWPASALMGGLLLAGVVAQVIVLKEWYLATVELLIFSLVQLGLSAYAAASLKGKSR